MGLVIFSHGKESGPKGSKIKLLSEVATKSGFKTISVDYTKCGNVGERVVLLQNILNNHIDSTTILTGSSMGGYVSTVVANQMKIRGLFLMCPALYMPGYDIQDYSPQTNKIEIIHGWNDTVVPFENSVKFGYQTKAELHLIEDGHRLANSYTFLKQRFEEFLQEIKK